MTPSGVYVRTPESRAATSAAMRRLPLPGPTATSYGAIHWWLRARYGKAAEHLCAECLGPARDWACVGEYVHDVAEFVPMCRKCHIWFDKIERG